MSHSIREEGGAGGGKQVLGRLELSSPSAHTEKVLQSSTILLSMNYFFSVLLDAYFLWSKPITCGKKSKCDVVLLRYRPPLELQTSALQTTLSGSTETQCRADVVLNISSAIHVK